MAIHTFAAIYIGSYEVSLKIFEISARKKTSAKLIISEAGSSLGGMRIHAV